MAIRDEIREQNEKVLKERSSSEKLKHFWHYYKVHVCVALLILAFITYLILHYTVFRPNPYAFAGYALGSEFYAADDKQPIQDFMQEFAEHEGIDREKYQVYFDVSNNLDPNGSSNFDMAIDMKLTKAGEHGNMDVIIGNADQIEFYEITGFYRPPLKDILPADLYEELDSQGLIYYFQPEEYGKEYPIGIYIGNAPRIQQLGLYPEDAEPILAVISISPRTEMAVSFIRFIFETP